MNTLADLEPYFREIVDEMWLGAWRIELTVADEADIPDAYATCEPVENLRIAVITLRSDWPDWDPDALRYILCHELVHCYLADLDPATNVLHDELNPSAWNLFRRAMLLTIERMTDHIASAWASQLPLPPPTNQPAKEDGNYEEEAAKEDGNYEETL